MWPYWVYLIVVSLGFVLLERARPWRPDQKVLRPEIGNDLFYLIFNGHFFAVLLMGPVSQRLSPIVEGWLGQRGLPAASVAADWSPAVQFVVAFVALDFIQWLVHNLLHRVPWLWTFHKVHHSIVDMDWIGSMRFHWMEIVVYKSAQYLPLYLLGFDGGPLLAVAVVATAIGHFNHANVDLDIGKLGYILNNPRMHIWHHHDVPGHPVLINFGISLSLWDWIFGTAHVPSSPPERLGYPDRERMPTHLPGQLVWPIGAPSGSRALS